MTTSIISVDATTSKIQVGGVDAIVFDATGIVSGLGKNKLINGNFGINQRAVSGTVVLAAGVYGHDRWKAGASGCTYTFATALNVTTITITAGSLIQVIEGLNLQSGDVVLSWTGTAQGKIGAGAYGTSGITGTAVGGTNLNVEFGTGTVSLVQLETGTTASAFEQRLFGMELTLCQRYYEIGTQRSRVEPFPGALLASAFFAAAKRAVPTITGVATLGTLSSFGAGGVNSAWFNFTAGSSGNIENTWTASAEL